MKDGRVTYEQPDRPFHLLQHLAGIGGDRAHPRAPQHGEEPGLVHHVQVDRDVVLAVLPAQGQPSSEQQPEKTVHLGCDPALAATSSNCLESQTQGRSAGKAEVCSQLHPLHQPCLIRHAYPQGCGTCPALPSSAPALSLSWSSPLLAPGTDLRQCPGITAPRLLGDRLSPDLLRGHVLIGQVDMQQWLLLILESLLAVNLLHAWGLLFDLFPEPIRQPEDLGKSQRAHADERCSRDLALFRYFMVGPGTHGLLRQLLPVPLSTLSSVSSSARTVS